MSVAPQRTLWIGPSGWSYPDWEGVVYPTPHPRGFKPLAYLARFVNAVEVNTSFYRIPTAKMTAAWPRQVPTEFRFAFKLTQIFTHERSAFPSAVEVQAFQEGLAPVAEAGQLGPLLIQFPWSFRHTPENADWLQRVADTFATYERCVEVRHASWATPEALAALRAAGGYCNIDQPRLHDCLPPTQHVFGRVAYIRLHGRNAANWFAEGLPPFERYNYLYSESELQEWVTRLNAQVATAEETYVFANNHYRGQGVANALELKALLTQERVDVPPSLRAAYPRLAAIAKPTAPTSLFDE